MVARNRMTPVQAFTVKIAAIEQQTPCSLMAYWEAVVVSSPVLMRAASCGVAVR